MQYSGWPESGELVVGEVDEIEDFGVFVDLLEYEDKRGLVHVSEVASGWIKNVRDHVNVDDVAVCKVLDVNTSSQQVDLSIKDVNDHQRSDKIQEWKNEQKADKWMELAFGEEVSDEQFASVAGELVDTFGSMYAGFEQAAIHGPEALDPTDLSGDEIDALVQTARKNVSVPYVTVTGYVDLTSSSPDGVDDVRAAMEAAAGNDTVPDEVDLDVTYVGAPEYRIRVQAPNYDDAEAELEASADRASDSITAAGGTAAFHRDRRTEAE
ncbi:MAG: translation initiation factor IF-2 subunit alpha [Halobacteriales archaeon]|nr:translation initiation factor IF-2 subunit alpha [Halobacteriales archaeon]